MDILNKLIKSEISYDEILQWLTTNNNENINFFNNAQIDSTPTEFISYFLEYLRKQCQGILNVGIDNPLEDQVYKNILNTPSIDQIKNFKHENKILKLSSINNDNENSSQEWNSSDTKLINNNNNIQLTSTPLKINIDNELSQTFSPIVKHKYIQSSNYSNDCNNIDSFSNYHNTSNISLQSKQSTINDSVYSNTSLDTNINSCSSISPLYKNNKPLKSHQKNFSYSKQKINENIDKNKNSESNKKINHHHRRSSICLGDFMNKELNNLKKNKKDNSKNQISILNSTDESKNILSTENIKNKSKSKRRIKPTKLNLSSETENQVQIFGTVNRPRKINPQFLETQSNDKSNEIKSFEIERELLKLERQKQQKIDIINENINQELKCVIKPIKSSSFIIPKLELVDNIEILNILAKLYSYLLCNNLILNPMSELYFIITLIIFQYKSTIDEDENNMLLLNSEINNSNSLNKLKKNLEVSDIIQNSDEININNINLQTNIQNNLESSINEKIDKKIIELSQNELNYFNTAHNCIYFAITTLYYGKNLLTILDRTALKMLYDNTLIISFQPDLREYLKELYSFKCLRSKQCKPYNNDSTLQTNVCFQIDTDNQENFHSLFSFCTFKKQRDLFYEILKIWEDNHLLPNWSFNKILEKKINILLSMHKDVINYYHIARLFKSQLLMSSIPIKQIEQFNDDQISNAMKYIKNLNPEKLKQLKERLVTPIKSLGPVPQPKFFGIQEFYKDFILVSSNPNFNVILQNCFIEEIMELNDTQFSCDIDIKENSVDENTKQNYIICLSRLRLMAKFLGFIISLPYQSEFQKLQSINLQIALRSRTLPPLDLQECLSNAIKNGKLSLTIPWLVQYLAMMDLVTFYLPYYKKLCKILYCIYRTAYNFLNQETSLLITFCIGWLFDLPNFPKELYYNWCLNYNNLIIEIKSFLNVNELIETTKLTEIITKNNNSCNIILDEMNIIDDRSLLISCEFLTEFRILLTSGNSNINCGNNNNNNNRHITPVSSQLSKSTNSIKIINLELQLENAFFHSQPRLIKKTIDFVSERVTSNCIKYICQFIITPIKKKSYKLWNKKLNENIFIKNELIQFIKIITNEINNEYKKIIPKLCEIKIKNSLESLLSDDILETVKNMSIKIAIKITMERINQWVESYINGVITSKDMYEEFLNKKSFDLDNNLNIIKKNNNINLNNICSSKIINDIRNSLWELIEQKEKWSILNEENILLNINNIKLILYDNNDLVKPIKNVLYTLSIDYALHIIVFKKQLMTINIENNFIILWKLYDNINKLLSGLLSPRNIKLLIQIHDKTIWIRYGKFIQKLLIENLLTIENFSDQCVAFLRIEWPVNILKSIPNCLLEAISHYSISNEHTEKIKYLIGWIAETCPELN